MAGDGIYSLTFDGLPTKMPTEEDASRARAIALAVSASGVEACTWPDTARSSPGRVSPLPGSRITNQMLTRQRLNHRATIQGQLTPSSIPDDQSPSDMVSFSTTDFAFLPNKTLLRTWPGYIPATEFGSAASEWIPVTTHTFRVSRGS